MQHVSEAALHIAATVGVLEIVLPQVEKGITQLGFDTYPHATHFSQPFPTISKPF